MIGTRFILSIRIKAKKISFAALTLQVKHSIENSLG